MELKRRISLGQIYFTIYFVAFFAYIVVGLQPAEATSNIHTKLQIPSIGLSSPVESLGLENSRLNTPNHIVGSYSRADNRTLLIGHSTGIFSNLRLARIGDPIIYDHHTYYIYNIYVANKNDISMTKLLEPTTKNSLVIMTCSGTALGNDDFTHRLILEAA